MLNETIITPSIILKNIILMISKKILLQPLTLEIPKNGMTVALGPPTQFMTPKRLAEIYDVEMGVFKNPYSERVIAYVREKSTNE